MANCAIHAGDTESPSIELRVEARSMTGSGREESVVGNCLFR